MKCLIFLVSSILLPIGFTSISKVYAVPEATQRKYVPPRLLKLHQRVVYSEDKAEVFIGLEPVLNFESDLVIDLKCSHDQFQIVSESGTIKETSVSVSIKPGKVTRLHYILERSGDFTMASLALIYEIPYPKDLMRDFILSNPQYYTNTPQREMLLDWIEKQGPTLEERSGVFFYKKKFLVPER